MRVVVRGTIALLAALFAGCRAPEKSVPAAVVSDPAALDALRAKVPVIDAARPTYRAVEKTLDTVGGNAIRYTAYFDGARVAYLHETIRAGKSGSSEHHYYFADGALIHYRRSETRRDEKSGRTDDAAMSLFFHPSGGVLESVKTLNGQPSPLDAREVSGIFSHLELLMEFVS